MSQDSKGFVERPYLKEKNYQKKKSKFHSAKVVKRILLPYLPPKTFLLLYEHFQSMNMHINKQTITKVYFNKAMSVTSHIVKEHSSTQK